MQKDGPLQYHIQGRLASLGEMLGSLVKPFAASFVALPTPLVDFPISLEIPLADSLVDLPTPLVKPFAAPLVVLPTPLEIPLLTPLVDFPTSLEIPLPTSLVVYLSDLGGSLASLDGGFLKCQYMLLTYIGNRRTVLEAESVTHIRLTNTSLLLVTDGHF